MPAAFSDYAYYAAHGGKLSEAAYAAAAPEAHAEILSQTGGAAGTAPGAMLDAVKLCECRLVDTITAYQQGAALLPKGVGSISNDGYTVAMGAGSDPAQDEAQARRAVCARYLQWPENLMCRWL